MSSIINGTTTKFSDLIEPTVFLDWITRADSKTNRFIQSGVLANDSALAGRLLQPGRVLEIPALNDLTGTPEEWNDSTDIKTNGLTSGMEYDIKMYEDHSFGASDWGDLVSGAPTLQQISARFGHFWSNWETKVVLATVQSAFLNADIATAKSFGVGAEKELSPQDFVKSLARMGDTMDNTLSTVVVNSAAYSEMRAQNLIEYVTPSNGGVPIATYQGMSIIQDDQIPVASDGTTYALIYGPGAIQYANATPANGLVAVRDEMAAGGLQAVIQKRVSTCHIAGTNVDLSQTNADTFRADLLAGTKSLFVVSNNSDPRHIQIVKYGFKVGTDYVVPKINTDAKPTPTPSK